MKYEKMSFPLPRLALALSLAGVVLGVLIAIVGRLINHDLAMPG